METLFFNLSRATALERAKGIEPSYAAWEAAVLPLNYARLFYSKISDFDFTCQIGFVPLWWQDNDSPTIANEALGSSWKAN